MRIVPLHFIAEPSWVVVPGGSSFLWASCEIDTPDVSRRAQRTETSLGVRSQSIFSTRLLLATKLVIPQSAENRSDSDSVSLILALVR